MVTASPGDDLHDAARMLMDNGCGHLPVVDDGRLVGSVARRDVLRPFRRSDDEIAHDVQRVLDDRVSFEQGYDVTFSVHDGTVAFAGTMTYLQDLVTLERGRRDRRRRPRRERVPGVRARTEPPRWRAERRPRGVLDRRPRRGAGPRGRGSSGRTTPAQH